MDNRPETLPEGSPRRLLDAVNNPRDLKKLPPEAKVKAAEYLRRPPEFVQTAVRSALRQEPWFSKPGNRQRNSGIRT